jgi:hypothetical protein
MCFQTFRLKNFEKEAEEYDACRKQLLVKGKFSTAMTNIAHRVEVDSLTKRLVLEKWKKQPQTPREVGEI